VDTREKLSARFGLGRIRTLCILALALTLPSLAAGDETSPLTRDQAKADVLLNLSRYIEWPEGVFLNTNSPVFLGIYGSTSLTEELRKQAKARRVNGRDVIVRQYYWPMDPNCQLLYIADTEQPRLPNILRKVQHSTVLTVSELPDFTTRGGMVHLTMKDNKGHFAVNVSAATEVHIKVSARLLNVADGVR
jgi:hypothetical protein